MWHGLCILETCDPASEIMIFGMLRPPRPWSQSWGYESGVRVAAEDILIFENSQHNQCSFQFVPVQKCLLFTFHRNLPDCKILSCEQLGTSHSSFCLFIHACSFPSRSYSWSMKGDINCNLRLCMWDHLAKDNYELQRVALVLYALAGAEITQLVSIFWGPWRTCTPLIQSQSFGNLYLYKKTYTIQRGLALVGKNIAYPWYRLSPNHSQNLSYVEAGRRACQLAWIFQIRQHVWLTCQHSHAKASHHHQKRMLPGGRYRVYGLLKTP